MKSIGELKPHPDVPDEWLISKPIPIPVFDGKELEFILDGYSDADEKFLVEADAAILSFLEKDKNDRKEISPLVFKNYVECIEAVIEDKDPVIEDMPVIENEEDVWQLIYPQAVYVRRRDRRDKNIYLQIECECGWEIEHGLQIVFRQGKKVTRVSSVDGHLTESDADNKPDEEDELLSKF